MLETMQKFNDFKTTKIPGSKYFTLHEALYLRELNAYAVPDVNQLNNIINLAKILDGIREYYNTPITITSWLRPEVYNKMIGGATFSQHKIGNAVDFIVNGLSSDKVRADLIANPNIRCKVSMETGITWVHIQNDYRNLLFPPPPKRIKMEGLT